MNTKTWQAIETDVPWLFIPLNHDVALNIYFWIKRWARTKEEDDVLAENCEKEIKLVFGELGLKYKTENYGEIKMNNLRIFSGTDGIAIPEVCFIQPNQNIKRIKNPLKPLAS